VTRGTQTSQVCEFIRSAARDRNQVIDLVRDSAARFAVRMCAEKARAQGLPLPRIATLRGRGACGLRIDAGMGRAPTTMLRPARAQRNSARSRHLAPRAGARQRGPFRRRPEHRAVGSRRPLPCVAPRPCPRPMPATLPPITTALRIWLLLRSRSVCVPDCCSVRCPAAQSCARKASNSRLTAPAASCCSQCPAPRISTLKHAGRDHAALVELCLTIEHDARASRAGARRCCPTLPVEERLVEVARQRVG
jgi:hypothetical protein